MVVKYLNIKIKKENWKLVDLPEVVFFQEGPGVRNNQYTNKGVKLLNVANLQNGQVVLENTDRFISKEEAYGRYKHFLVEEGDLIIASSGIKVEYFDKKMGFIKKEHLPLCMNTSTIRFKSLDKSILNIRYFMYFLKSVYFKKQLFRLITGSAQLNFGPSHLNQIKVILPDISLQLKIVDLLDKIQSLIDKRKAQIEALDQLTQSVFLKMFGNPIQNDKKWPIKSFDYFANIDTVMVNDFTSFQESSHVGIDSIERDSGRISNYRTVKEDNVKSGKYLFTDKHIIYSKIRPYLNKVATPDFSGVCSADSYPILVNKEHASKQYLAFLMRSEAFLNHVNQQSSRTNIPKINKKQLLLFAGMCPPVELQVEFDFLYSQIEEQRKKMISGLYEFNNLFESLMQRTFKE
jgi:type I restriction enzyme, S subunit